MRSIVVIAHNIRSTHNVGSLLRTAEGLGVEEVFFTGITPYPATKADSRLPHIVRSLTNKIAKTALGAENLINWKHVESVEDLILNLKQSGYCIIGLEQDKNSVKLPSFRPPKKCALLLGEEVKGIDKLLLEKCDYIVEIPMYGKKESFNVVQASAIALHALREA